MKLSGRKANSVLAFVDAGSGEALLRATADSHSEPLLAYHLYDSRGDLVADVPEPASYPDGLTVTANDGEVLLHVPAKAGESIHYRLYNRDGFLMTWSDGLRTQIFGFLRMDSA